VSGSRAPVLVVDGARQLRATMKRAGLSLDDLKAAHLAVAQLVDRAAKPHAPVGETGRLVGSERAAGTQSAAIVRAGSARVPYAGPIHWGWPNRHIVAQPWLYEAAADTEAAWLAMYLRAIEAVVATIEGAEGQ
jgi:hypothetical protein